MSQKLSLVRFEIEDQTPIDETSERIKSSYIPDEFVDLLAERNLSAEIDIKESAGINPDIPVVFVDKIDGAIHEVEVKLAELISSAHEQVSGELLIDKEIDNSYRELLIWLKLREIFKIKQDKYLDDSQIKLVVG